MILSHERIFIRGPFFSSTVANCCIFLEKLESWSCYVQSIVFHRRRRLRDDKCLYFEIDNINLYHLVYVFDNVIECSMSFYEASSENSLTLCLVGIDRVLTVVGREKGSRVTILLPIIKKSLS